MAVLTDGAEDARNDGRPSDRGVADARRFAVTLGVIVLGGLVVRLLYAFVVEPHVPRISDAGAYHLLANNLADGRGFIRPFDLSEAGLVHTTAEYPPLWPALLSVVPLLGGRSIDAQLVLTCLLGTGTVAVIGLLGRRVAGGTVGIAAAGIAAVYPMLFQADGVLMAESLFALLVTVALLLAYRVYDEPGVLRVAALGVVLGLSALTRTEGLLLAVVLVVPLAVRLPALSTRRRIGLAALGVGAALLVVAPWTIRNQIEFDRFVPVANNTGTAIDGANCSLVYSGSQIGLWRSTFGVEGAGRQCFDGFDITARGFNEAEVAATHRDAGLEYAGDHLGRVPVVMAVRGLRTWGLFDPGQQLAFEALEGRSDVEGRTSAWQWAGLGMYWTVLVLAIGGTVLLWRARQRVWPLLATAVTVSIATVLTYGNQRFRIAAEPAILVLGAVALVEIARRFGARSPRRGR